MKLLPIVRVSVLVVAVAALDSRHPVPLGAAAEMVPSFKYDPTWPKQLPNNWIVGSIGAMTMDAKDHIWVVQRPGATTNLSERYGLTGESECCWPAPPVMEFDTAGNLIQAWGPIHGDDEKAPRRPAPAGASTSPAAAYVPQVLLGKQVSGPYPDDAWPFSEHGILIDPQGNVWVSSQNAPSQVVKLTHDGKFLMRLGKREAISSNDTENFAGPTGIAVDPKTNEVFIADGYRNRRVIVFDATTGAYKRHWGAYGKRPPDGPQMGPPTEPKYDPKVRSEQFAVVHCAVIGNDGLLYVCDRGNDRIQVFKLDGTFVKEAYVAPQTLAFGSLDAIAFSPDREQRFMYVADGPNHKVWILRHSDLKVVGAFGKSGRGGGQLLVAHALAVDARGNVYVGETINNNRVQKFTFTGMKPSAMN